jgi:serine/threonine protein phosphatase PrpC
MQIKIHPPIALWEKGTRLKNEDNIYPSQAMADKSSSTFLVCDGVGGASKGELASQIVANIFGSMFDHQIASASSLHYALEQVQDKIDQYILENEEHREMGSTLSFLQFNEGGAIIAHAGDSRVYHVRKDEILFCTSDHSLVNELLKRGKFEEAKLAKGNIITRAVQGRSVKEITLDVQEITDIQAGDYFLLCSDGVWGVISDDRILDILGKSDTNEVKMDVIHQICESFSRDNYSAFLIEIKEVIKDQNRVDEINEDTLFERIQNNMETTKPTFHEMPMVHEATEFETRWSEFSTNKIIDQTSRRSFPSWTIILLLILIGIVTYVIWNNSFIDLIF